jgi:hypothetical protein
VVTGTVLVERQLSYDLLLDIWVRVRRDDLVAGSVAYAVIGQGTHL